MKLLAAVKLVPTKEQAKVLTYQAIADRLGVTLAMARRRALQHERMLREAAAKSADRPQRSRQ